MNDQQHFYKPLKTKQQQYNQQSQSPFAVDQTDRYSGLTNSGDIVKVKESNYQVTNPDDCYANEFTQFAQNSNRIDYSSTYHDNYQNITPLQKLKVSNIGHGTSMIENKIMAQQLNHLPSSQSILNYSLKSFQQEDSPQQESLCDDINISNHASHTKDHEVEQAVYSAQLQPVQVQKQQQKVSHTQSLQNHSQYSDDHKKSVFLYSSSNDDMAQSQASIKQSQQNRHSSKNSLQFFSNYNSNSTIANVDGNQNNLMFRTTSSNFQLSDLTLSLNAQLNQQNQRNNNFMESEGFEIKEEEEENCYTPLDQFYPEQQQQQQQPSYQNSKVVEDSFILCDYDEYMEEKCSLSENPGTGPPSPQSKHRTQSSSIHNTSKPCQDPKSSLGAQSSSTLPPKPILHNSSISTASNQFTASMRHYQGSLASQKQQQQELHNEYYEQEDDGRQEMIEYLTSNCDDGFVETFGIMDNQISPQQQQLLVEEPIATQPFESNENTNEQTDQHQLQDGNQDETENNEDQQQDYDQEDQQDYEIQYEDKQYTKYGVLDRLYEHQRKKEQKLEEMRIRKKNQEMMQVTSRPVISEVSKAIVKNMGNQLPTYKDYNQHFEKQKKIEDLKRLYEMDKLKEVTGKPKISERARSLNRDITDLYDWQKTLQYKKESLQRYKEDQERQEQEEHMNKAQKYVNKVSARLIANKENLYNTQKIEERLLQAGHINKQKRDQMAKAKEIEDIQLTQMLHQKKKQQFGVRKNSVNNEKTQKLDKMDQVELNKLAQNKNRQDLYRLYYNDKKKEAECKMLSSTMLNSVFSMSPVGQVYQQSDYNSFANQIPVQPINAPNHMTSNSLTYMQSVPYLTQGLNSPSDIAYRSFQSNFSAQSQPQYFDQQKHGSFGNLQSNTHSSQESLPTFQKQSLGTAMDVYQLLRTAHQDNSNTQSVASTSCFEQNTQRQLDIPKPNSKPTTMKSSVVQLTKPTASSRNKSKTRQEKYENTIISPQSSLSPKGHSQRTYNPKNTEVYERQRKWSQERKHKIQQEQEKVNLLNTLKCTFKPQISEQSRKLMSPSNKQHRQNRMRVYEYDTKVNFNKKLIHQLANSQISPLKEAQDSFISKEGEQRDPFLEQFAGQSNVQKKFTDELSTQKVSMHHTYDNTRPFYNLSSNNQFL